METQLWETHEWFDRPLETDPDERMVQFVCRKCGRAFVNDPSGRRYAVHTSTFAVYRLSDEVTDRWLSEPCPTERQSKDRDDEKSRFTNGSGAAKLKSN